MHQIPTTLQVIHVISKPLQHLTPSIQILRMVVVLIHMGKLRLNPSRVIALIIQDGTHGVAEAVTGQSPLVTQQLNDLNHWFLF